MQLLLDVVLLGHTGQANQPACKLSVVIIGEGVLLTQKLWLDDVPFTEGPVDLSNLVNQCLLLVQVCTHHLDQISPQLDDVRLL